MNLKKIINIIFLFFAIFILENIICFILLNIYYYNNLDIKGCSDVTILYNVWRLYFFGIPTLLLFIIILYKKFDIKPLFISIMNSLFFIVLTIITELLLNNFPIDFSREIFWITSLAIFTSPLILFKIKFAKKKLENLNKNNKPFLSITYLETLSPKNQ